jgi:Skp family chaperone for outer membrane proteins
VDVLTSSRLQEAEKAKAVIADLEAELQAERMRLRKMSTEQERLQREIGEVARQLQRTETVIMIMNIFRFLD